MTRLYNTFTGEVSIIPKPKRTKRPKVQYWCCECLTGLGQYVQASSGVKHRYQETVYPECAEHATLFENMGSQYEILRLTKNLKNVPYRCIVKPVRELYWCHDHLVGSPPRNIQAVSGWRYRSPSGGLERTVFPLCLDCSRIAGTNGRWSETPLVPGLPVPNVECIR